MFYLIFPINMPITINMNQLVFTDVIEFNCNFNCIIIANQFLLRIRTKQVNN